MHFLRTFLTALAVSTASAKLLIDFTGGDDPSKLGHIELERYTLGDRIPAGEGGDDVFIKNEEDKSLSRPSLHFKRSAHFRRAEMRILENTLHEGNTYYVGYKFRLPHSRAGLVVWQWKKDDKYAAPAQNIPFHLEFTGHDKLSLDYTTPGGNGSNRNPVWGGDFSTGEGEEHIHSVAFAINTDNSGKGWLEFYLDGKKQAFDNGKERLENVYLFTGETRPKLGLYRGEAPQGDESNPDDHTFNSYVYRVQISDSSLDEVAEAGGLDGGSTPEPPQDPTSTEVPEEPTTTAPSEPEHTPTETETGGEPPSTTPPPTSTPSPQPTCKSSRKKSRRSRHRRRSLRRRLLAGTEA